MKRSVLVSLFAISTIILLFGQANMNVTAQGADTPTVEKPVAPDFPAIGIFKYIKDTKITPSQVLTVQINITNFGKSSAYNLTVTEPKYADQSGAIVRPAKTYNWTRLDTNASILFSFQIKFDDVGIYRVGRTKITYYDENSTLFTSLSRYYKITVTENPKEIDLSQYWRNMAFIEIGLGFIPLIVVLYNFRKFPFNYLKK